MKKTAFSQQVKLAFMSSLKAVAAGSAQLGMNNALAGRAKRKADESREASRQLREMTESSISKR